MYKVLDEFIPICEYKSDFGKVKKYKEIMNKLKKH